MMYFKVGSRYLKYPNIGAGTIIIAVFWTRFLEYKHKYFILGLKLFPMVSKQDLVLSPHRAYSPFSDLLRWNEVVENILCIS